MTPEEIQEFVRPALISQTILDYPAPEEINQQHVGSNTQEMPDIEREVTDAGKENNPSKKASDLDDMSVSDVTTDEVQAEPDEFFIDSIVNRRVNRSRRHRHAKYGD